MRCASAQGAREREELDRAAVRSQALARGAHARRAARHALREVLPRPRHLLLRRARRFPLLLSALRRARTPCRPGYSGPPARSPRGRCERSRCSCGRRARHPWRCARCRPPVPLPACPPSRTDRTRLVRPLVQIGRDVSGERWGTSRASSIDTCLCWEILSRASLLSRLARPSSPARARGRRLAGPRERQAAEFHARDVAELLPPYWDGPAPDVDGPTSGEEQEAARPLPGETAGTAGARRRALYVVHRAEELGHVTSQLIAQAGPSEHPILPPALPWKCTDLVLI